MPGVASGTAGVVGATDSVMVAPADMPELTLVSRLLRPWLTPAVTAPTVTTALAPIAAISRISLMFKLIPFVREPDDRPQALRFLHL